MEQAVNHDAFSVSSEMSISRQEALCRELKEQLDQIHADVLQKQFALTGLNNPGFFQRHFGNLKKKKDAAWRAYREACLTLEQAKLDYAQQTALLDKLRSAPVNKA